MWGTDYQESSLESGHLKSREVVTQTASGQHVQERKLKFHRNHPVGIN